MLGNERIIEQKLIAKNNRARFVFGSTRVQQRNLPVFGHSFGLLFQCTDRLSTIPPSVVCIHEVLLLCADSLLSKPQADVWVPFCWPGR